MTDLASPSLRPMLALIAIEQEWFARSLESILAPSGYAVLRADHGAQAREFARGAQPDLIVVDAALDDRQGIAVCESLRAEPAVGVHTPIILTASAPLSTEQCSAAFLAGVWDVVVQPVNGELFLLRARNFVQAKREVDRVSSESLLDHATGLYNMRGLARRAREIGAEAMRQRGALACVAFSSSPGPSISPNWSSGPVTRRVAEICRRLARQSDVIGRVGQSEFAILAPNTGDSGAQRLIARLEDAAGAIPVREGSPDRLVLRTGYYAVPDLSEATLDAVEVMLRAMSALGEVRGTAAAGAPRLAALGDSAPRFLQ